MSTAPDTERTIKGNAMQEKEIHGVAAAFDSPDGLLRAARELRKNGYTKIEAYTPFPVHGIDDILGIPHSKLGYFVLVGGLTGTSLALLLQWWTNAGNPNFLLGTGLGAYPLVIGGKPLFALESSIPITFELTVLLASFTAVFGMLALNGLPSLYHSIFNFRSAPRVTDDQFVLVVERADPRFDALEASRLFRSLDAESVEIVEQ
jgi:hypothetical protein